MTILRLASNLSRGTAFESRLEIREDKEAISNTPATGSAEHFVDTTTEQQFYMDFLTALFFQILLQPLLAVNLTPLQ